MFEQRDLSRHQFRTNNPEICAICTNSTPEIYTVKLETAHVTMMYDFDYAVISELVRAKAPEPRCTRTTAFASPYGNQTKDLGSVLPMARL
jgi:hypothetical protein